MKIKIINNKEYVSAYNHKEIDIWALKIATPSKGDELGYLVESFSGIKYFNTVSDAIEAIERIGNNQG